LAPSFISFGSFWSVLTSNSSIFKSPMAAF
jgi:hypothetical protein